MRLFFFFTDICLGDLFLCIAVYSIYPAHICIYILYVFSSRADDPYSGKVKDCMCDKKNKKNHVLTAAIHKALTDN